MVTRIVWSRHIGPGSADHGRVFALWNERKSLQSTVQWPPPVCGPGWLLLIAEETQGSDRPMADAIPELWPEDGQVYPILGNTMEANTFQYYSEDDPTSIQCQTILGNTTQYHTPRSDSDSKVMVERWSTDCNSSNCPGMGHLWPHNSLKQKLRYIFKTNTPTFLNKYFCILKQIILHLWNKYTCI